MTQYLLDTNVVSSFAPGKPAGTEPAGDVETWFARNSRDLFISAMTVMEIESGIERLAKRGSIRRSSQLAAWFSGLLRSYRERVLAFDREVASVAGRIEAESIVKGRNPGLPDVIIAATATTYRLTVLTRNLRHFRPLGVTAIDPFREFV